MDFLAKIIMEHKNLSPAHIQQCTLMTKGAIAKDGKSCMFSNIQKLINQCNLILDTHWTVIAG